jgi:hypothetical protein
MAPCFHEYSKRKNLIPTHIDFGMLLKKLKKFTL